MAKREKYGECVLCHREVELTFHHLIPKTLHKTKWYKKNFSNEELNSGIDICRKCHNGIHDFYDEKRLGKEFNTLQSLLEDPTIIKHCAWVSKQK